MSGNLGILCFHSGIIVNTDNDITSNGGSHEFLTTTLDMSLNKLSRILYDRLGWNMFEIKVEITWRMLQIRINQALYVSVPIYSDESVNSIFEFARINGINMLELYFITCHIRWCGARHFIINLTHDFLLFECKLFSFYLLSNINLSYVLIGYMDVIYRRFDTFSFTYIS